VLAPSRAFNSLPALGALGTVADRASCHADGVPSRQCVETGAFRLGRRGAIAWLGGCSAERARHAKLL
jgi:hypothetical protein